MIAAMVGALFLLVLGLVIFWMMSPAFRTWTERPKFQMLEREAMYERAETLPRTRRILDLTADFDR